MSIMKFHNPNWTGLKGSTIAKYLTNHYFLRPIRDLETLFLNSTHVLAETRRHYNCPNADGM